MSRAKKTLRIVIMVGLALAGVLGLGGGFVQWKSSQRLVAPYPALTADQRPEAVARGRVIFEVKCAGCHQQQGAPRASGGHLAELPPPLGTFYSSNITRHPTAGIGSRTDGELARAVRFGVTSDGRRSVMGWALSDDDLSAVLGYLRSDDARFEADPTEQPQSAPSLLGRAVLVFAMPVPERPARVVAPPKTDPVRYGEYLAKAVYDCGDCHSAGFGEAKLSGPRAFRGGFEFRTTGGGTLLSRNLTFHPTGLAGWSQGDFLVALREGVTPRGEVLRDPMPRFREVEDAELLAIYAFLATLPLGESEAKPSQSSGPHSDAAHAPPPNGLETEEAMFDRLGCAGCHGPQAPFHAQLEAARGKPPEQLATWIRHPEARKPGTPMPTYARLLDERQALRLAQWVSAGRP